MGYYEMMVVGGANDGDSGDIIKRVGEESERCARE